MGSARTEFLMFINVHLNSHKWQVATVLDRAEDICSRADLTLGFRLDLKLRSAFPKATRFGACFGTRGWGTGTEFSLSQCCVWVY